jgi:PAS domain S-box-containing protein
MEKILRILHLEDVRSDADIVKREMTKSGIAFEWRHVSTKTDFQRALVEFSPDIILSDHTLPGFSSVQALKMVREAGIAIPFILVTATVSEEFAANMIKEGVADYLLKDRLQRLPNAVLQALDTCKREKEKEEHLSEIIRGEANLKAIIENSDVTIYSLDKEFKYITFNSLLKNTLKEIYGLDIKVGDNVLNFLKKLDPDEARNWENIYTKALSGKSIKFEKEFKGPDFYRYTSFSINPIWENNSIIGLSCFAHDTTEQRIAQEKLRQSEEKYRNIIETAQEGIWIINDKYETTFVNKKLCEILQYTAEEILKKNLFDFMDDESKVIAEGIIQRGKIGINETLDFKLITKSGELVWTSLSTSFLMNEEGKYIGALAMVTDITARKTSEQQQQKVTSDLIQRNKDLEQFAYIVSHNFRAPVANILGICNVLQYRNLSTEQREEIEKGISISAQKLDNVIVDLNNILQVKREVSEKKEEILFSELVRDIQESISGLIEKEHVTIITDFTGFDKLLTLKSYMHSIFYNLISNSIKYRKHDCSPVIEIKTKKTNNNLELTFKDNGTGIDLTLHSEKIFGLYKRFHGAEIDGKGMGLFMVKTQVETLGGKISVVSAVNEGTTFKIHFEL